MKTGRKSLHAISSIDRTAGLPDAAAGVASSVTGDETGRGHIHYSGPVNSVFHPGETVFRTFELAFKGASFQLDHPAADGHAAFTISSNVRGPDSYLRLAAEIRRQFPPVPFKICAGYLVGSVNGFGHIVGG